MFCAFWVDLSTLLKQKLSKTTTENADTVCKKHCQYSHSPQSVVYVFVRFVVDVRPTTRTESAWVWVLVASCWLNCGAFFWLHFCRAALFCCSHKHVSVSETKTPHSTASAPNKHARSQQKRVQVLKKLLKKVVQNCAFWTDFEHRVLDKNPEIAFFDKFRPWVETPKTHDLH